MKKIILLLVIALPTMTMAQIGLKAGWNFTDVTSASSISNQSSSGYNFGIFYTTPYTKIIGSKTELVYSRQGYNYSTGTVTGKVNLDYIMLPEYFCINITKFFQIHVGEEMAYLINAQADSTPASNPGIPGGSYSQITSFYNRFQFALGGGVEVHPILGLLIGARINFSLTNLYATPDINNPNQTPSFVPTVNVKSNLLQIYAGWKFGK